MAWRACRSSLSPVQRAHDILPVGTLRSPETIPQRRRQPAQWCPQLCCCPLGSQLCPREDLPPQGASPLPTREPAFLRAAGWHFQKTFYQILKENTKGNNTESINRKNKRFPNNSLALKIPAAMSPRGHLLWAPVNYPATQPAFSLWTCCHQPISPSPLPGAHTSCSSQIPVPNMILLKYRRPLTAVLFPIWGWATGWRPRKPHDTGAVGHWALSPWAAGSPHLPGRSKEAPVTPRKAVQASGEAGRGGSAEGTGTRVSRPPSGPGAVPVLREQRVPEGHLPQLAPRLQCGPDHVHAAHGA